jgi:hypothetical protein
MLIEGKVAIPIAEENIKGCSLLCSSPLSVLPPYFIHSHHNLPVLSLFLATDTKVNHPSGRNYSCPLGTLLLS